MDIRQFEGEADARAIARINALAWREAYDDLLPDEFLAGLDPDPSDDAIREFAGQLRADREGIFVAEAGSDAGTGSPADAVCGYSYVRWGDDTKSFVGPDEAGLKEIYVDPAHWGEGVGTALLERILEALPESVEQLKLETLEGNDIGQRFYDARGFERVGDAAFEIDGEAYPTVLYALEV